MNRGSEDINKMLRFDEVDSYRNDSIRSSLPPKQNMENEFNEAEGYEDDEEDGDEFQAITEIAVPEWINVILAVTGIAALQYRIEVERARREDPGFQNRFLEIQELVMSMSFEILIGSVIIFNCALIGWEASVEEGGALTMFFNVFEHFFTAFFLIEWCLRILAFGWVWIFEFGNFIDTLLVFGTGVLVKWVAEPAGVDLGAFRIVTVLRALRLVRLARAVRLQDGFKEMWILVQGLRTSARPLLWTLVIANSVLYVFAIAATEFIGKHEDFKDDELAQEFFGNFLRSMFSMVQVITMDSHTDVIVRPLMETQGWLALFFVLFICIGVFIVMNLVTALIVDNAQSIRAEDKQTVGKELENKKRAELKMLAGLFFELDTDGSGELSEDEFFDSIHKNKKVRQVLDLLEMKVSELEDTWTVLDDGDGSLTIKEFTDGIRRMKGEAKAKDIADVIKKLRQTDRKHEELKVQADRYTRTLKELDQDAQEMSQHTKEVVGLFKEMYHRLSSHIAKGEREDLHRQREQEKLAKQAEGMEQSSSEESAVDEE